MILPLVMQPLSWVYSGLHQLRNFSYDNHLLNTQNFDVPIVSVGNITVGGTGKTPIVGNLIEALQAKGKKVGVVSRGYKGDFSGVHKVTVSNKSIFFGDEPTMLALKYPELPIYVCPDRIKAVQTLIKNHKVDLILADDAFQHRRLGRALDILVFDLTQGQKAYKLLPYGQLREPMSGAVRAGVLIFNKANLAPPDAYGDLIKILKERVEINAPILKCNYVFKGLRSINGLIKPLSPESKVLLVSGVARPETVESLLNQAGQSFVEHVIYKDHHMYTEKNVTDLLDKARKLGASCILVTEKDAVKLRKFSKLVETLYVIELGLEIEDAEIELYEKIISLTN